MTAGQKMLGKDGKEVMLFPLTNLYISQGEYETYSHAGILAMDFLEFDANGNRVWAAPLYAPCTCTCVATIDPTNNGRVFQSVGQVHTPQGLRSVLFMFFHDDNPIAMVGSRFNQGQVIGHTGTAGGVADHVHFNTAIGTFNPLNFWENVPPEGKGELVGSSHIYDTCYVNGTIMWEQQEYNYDWQYFPYTGIGVRSKFPWVLYARQYKWYE